MGDVTNPQVDITVQEVVDPVSPLAVLDKVTKDDFMIAETAHELERTKYQDAIEAVKELAKFFKDIAEVN